MKKKFTVWMSEGLHSRHEESRGLSDGCVSRGCQRRLVAKMQYFPNWGISGKCCVVATRRSWQSWKSGLFRKIAGVVCDGCAYAQTFSLYLNFLLEPLGSPYTWHSDHTIFVQSVLDLPKLCSKRTYLHYPINWLPVRQAFTLRTCLVDLKEIVQSNV